MAKKKSTAPAGHSKRLDPADYGIDLPAVLEEIRDHFGEATNVEIAKRSGLHPVVVSQLFCGIRSPSLGAVAALAAAAGGRLDVTFRLNRPHE